MAHVVHYLKANPGQQFVKFSTSMACPKNCHTILLLPSLLPINASSYHKEQIIFNSSLWSHQKESGYSQIHESFRKKNIKKNKKKETWSLTYKETCTITCNTWHFIVDFFMKFIECSSCNVQCFFQSIQILNTLVKRMSLYICVYGH